MGQLFGFAVLTMTGYATANEVLASGFGNATFLMVLLGAAFAECLDQIGVTEGIAYWLLSKKDICRSTMVINCGTLCLRVLNEYGQWWCSGSFLIIDHYHENWRNKWLQTRF